MRTRTVDNALTSAALAIAERLYDTAERSGNRSTWQVPRAVSRADLRSNANIPTGPAGPFLYKGTSGIAIYLAEVYALTGDKRMAGLATEAMRDAILQVRSGSKSLIGLYSGDLGVCYAAERVGSQLQVHELREFAREHSRRLLGARIEDTLLDVIDGSAGAILALLYLAERDEFGHALVLATQLGEHLLRAAIHLPEGWAWSGSAHNTRPLTGLAHGACGVALAMAELGIATGETRFKHACIQALTYEQEFFNPVSENWPDFRSPHLSDYLSDGRISELKKLIRDGWSPSPYQRSEMTAWCHGAAGIGLARLRIHSLFGDPSDALAGLAATRCTARAIKKRFPSNYSLCHGLAGNCELLHSASQIDASENWSDVATSCLREAAERYGSQGEAHWPSGAPRGVSDPSLLLGEAGIGLALLQATGHQATSVLLIGPTAIKEPRIAEGTDATTLSDCRVHAVHAFFASAPGALKLIDFESVDWTAQTQSRKGSAVAQALREVSEGVGSIQVGSSVPALVDARIILTCASLLSADLNLDQDFCEALAREPEQDVLWNEGQWKTAYGVRILITHQDGKWADRGSCSEAAVLVRRNRLAVTVKQLPPFAGWILNRLSNPASLSVLTEAALCKYSHFVHDQVAELVAEQLRTAYRARLVVRSWPLNCLNPTKAET